MTPTEIRQGAGLKGKIKLGFLLAVNLKNSLAVKPGLASAKAVKMDRGMPLCKPECPN